MLLHSSGPALPQPPRCGGKAGGRGSCPAPRAGAPGAGGSTGCPSAAQTGTAPACKGDLGHFGPEKSDVGVGCSLRQKPESKTHNFLNPFTARINKHETHNFKDYK